MPRWKRIERAVFTLIIGMLLAWAVYVSTGWMLRAAILILVLGSIGVFLAALQFASDMRTIARGAEKTAGHFFDAPEVKQETRWGNVEMWAWILGFWAAIHTIGFPAAVVIFVLAYVKTYGSSWPVALGLAAIGWGILYGLYRVFLNVPWPDAILLRLLWP